MPVGPKPRNHRLVAVASAVLLLWAQPVVGQVVESAAATDIEEGSIWCAPHSAALDEAEGSESWRDRLRSPTLAFTLSLVLPGTGQYYYRDLASGTFYLVGGTGLGVSSTWLAVEDRNAAPHLAITYGAWALTSAIHAAIGTHEHNRRVVAEETGRRPRIPQAVQNELVSVQGAFFLNFLLPGSGLYYVHRHSTDPTRRRRTLGGAVILNIATVLVGVLPTLALSGNCNDLDEGCPDSLAPLWIWTVGLPALAILSGATSATAAARHNRDVLREWDIPDECMGPRFVGIQPWFDERAGEASMGFSVHIRF